jgi:radical SAM-linked protein
MADTNPESGCLERILFRFTKGDPVRFVGHLDLMRVFDRAIRRSGFPIGYSQGFNPRPRLAFASALTLGATSDWELCQLDLAEDLDATAVRQWIDTLRGQLPSGITILEAWPIPLERKSPYLQVNAAEYALALVELAEEAEAAGTPAGAAAARVRQFLEQCPALPGETQFSLEEGAGEVLLRIRLPVGAREGVRIRDLIAELEQAVPGIRLSRLNRTRLWCEQEPDAESM